MELVQPYPLCCELFSAFADMVTASYYCHTYAGLVIRTLPAAPVDNIYWIFIFSLTVLPQSLYANLLFSIFGPDLEIWPTVGTLLSSSAAPSKISLEKVHSTTTFHDPCFRTTGLEAVTKSQNKKLFVKLI